MSRPLSLSVLAGRASQQRAPLFERPSDREARQLKLTDLRGQVGDDERKRQEAAAIKQILIESNGDHKVAAQRIAQINPVLGNQLMQTIAQEEQAAQAQVRQGVLQGRQDEAYTREQAERARADAERAKADEAFQLEYQKHLALSGLEPRADREAAFRAQLTAKPAQRRTATVQGALVDQDTGEVVYQAPEKPAVPPAQIPGRDVPLPPEVEQQQIRMKKAEAAIKAASAGSESTSDAIDIADAIIRGEAPPLTTGLYKLAGPVRAELAKKGYNHALALSDWNGTQKHLATLNGAQQERLRQAITFTYDSLDNIDELYAEWKKQAGVSGYKVLNRANLKAMQNLPGKAGATATALEAQIADLTSELGTVYKGGNSSTDHSLELASKNLSAEWNEATFTKAMENIRKNLTIRKNSILSSEAVGVRPDSPYVPAPPAPAVGGGAAPQLAGPPKSGDIQKHNGDTYKFDGKVWRKQ